MFIPIILVCGLQMGPIGNDCQIITSRHPYQEAAQCQVGLMTEGIPHTLNTLPEGAEIAFFTCYQIPEGV